MHGTYMKESKHCISKEPWNRAELGGFVIDYEEGDSSSSSNLGASNPKQSFPANMPSGIVGSFCGHT